METSDFTQESQRNMGEKSAVDVEEDLDVRLYSQDESEEELSINSDNNHWNCVKKRKSHSKLYKSEKKDSEYKAGNTAKITRKYLSPPPSPMECPSSDNTFLSLRRSCTRSPFQYSSDTCGSQQQGEIPFSANVNENLARSHSPKETFILTTGFKYSDSCKLDLSNNQPRANIISGKLSTENYSWESLECQENDCSPSGLKAFVGGKIEVQSSSEADILTLHKREEVKQRKREHISSKNDTELLDYQSATEEDSYNGSAICRNYQYQLKEISSDTCELKKNTSALTMEKSPTEMSLMSKKRKDDYMSKLSKKTRSLSDESHETWQLLSGPCLKSSQNGNGCEFDQPKMTRSAESNFNFPYPKQNSKCDLNETNYSYRTARNSQSKFSYLRKSFCSTSYRNLQGNWREACKPKAELSSTLDVFHPLSNYYSPLDNEPHRDQDSKSLQAFSYTASKEITDSKLWRQASGSQSERKIAACTRFKKSTYSDYDEKEIQTTLYKPGFIDTHCHLDFLFQRTSHMGSYAKFQTDSQSTDPFPVSYEGCVAIFCKPWTFKKISWWEDILATSNVWAAFGCHPHFCDSFGDEEEGYLRHALQNVKTVALGEIGLDYSSKKIENHELQQTVFRKQLHMAMEYKKPVVIHCRDAHEDCIKILKEVVPRDYLIHRHCFTETWIEAEEWLETFSRVYLGFTNLVTYATDRRSWNIREAVRRIPLNRLLLETDAPYFRPSCYSDSGNLSHPGMAIHVAAQVAKLRKEEIQVVLNQARNNTRDMYGI